MHTYLVMTTVNYAVINNDVDFLSGENKITN